MTRTFQGTKRNTDATTSRSSQCCTTAAQGSESTTNERWKMCLKSLRKIDIQSAKT